ncbi:MAG: molybdate ABC transporter permease subunit [Coriobacteriia bacterium]|nr:molybdate ABC transporter permease subunit [Coriobacteriia bacterium]
MNNSPKRFVLVVMVLILVLGTMFALPLLAQANEQVSIDAQGTAAGSEGASFGIDDFARNNKGSARTYEGRDVGYRYPMAGASAFAALVLEDKLVIFIPEEVQATLGLDFTNNKAAQEQFVTLLKALDAHNARGGITLEQLNLPVVFTNAESIQHAGSIITFGVEVEPGYYYVVLTADPSAATTPDTSKLISFMATGTIVASENLVITPAPKGLEAFKEFLTHMDYRPFWVSMRTALTALVFVFILGLAAARLTLRVSNNVKDLLDAIFTIPLVLPPTVIGFLLLVTFGNSTAFGRWLIDNGIEVVFSWPAAVIAATVVAFPLMYRTVRGAFEAQDPEMLDVARTLGWKESRIFFRLMLPLAWPSIAAGTVLSFARALGEFGATLFVAGNFAGVTQTMPLAIYFEWMGGRSDAAVFWVVVVIIISFIVIFFINLYARHTQKFRMGTAKEEDKGEGIYRFE